MKRLTCFFLACVLPALAASPPAGVVLIPADASAFKPAIWVEDKSIARVEPVTVSGKDFSNALRLTITQPSPQPWQVGVAAKTVGPIRKNDILWLTLQARSITSTLETGESVATLVLMMKNDAGKEIRPLERNLTCGRDWTETSIPFVVPQDVEAGAATLAIRFGGAAQSFEVGGITLLNCGTDADFAKLPRAGGRYAGHAPDAPWRAAAAERIERLRKGDFPLKVVDASGNPVAGAAVAVRMKRHAFSFGAAVDAKRLVAAVSPGDARYREIIETYFTKVVFGNDLKWGRWIEQKPADRQNLLAALDWLDARKIPVRGHVMIWPSWQYTPPFLRTLEKDPAALRKAVSDHIAEQTAAVGTRLVDWDVINETYAHHDVVDILGRDVMADWFRLAHAGAPAARLFYNDYTLFHGTSPDSPSQHFHDTIRFLLDRKAPIGGIGEQGHFVGNPAGPAEILAALDRFGKFGLPIQITEFDIDTVDEQLQADFTRDFMTAVFSHPAVDALIHWDFWESPDVKPAVPLWRKDWTIRPNGQVFVDLVSKTWWTNGDAVTSDDGSCQFRGFLGDYEVTVSHAGKTSTERLELAPGAKLQTITLR